MAIAHRDMPASPTERTFSESRAKKLRETFESGHMLPCAWAKAEWQGKEVRMNGQHSASVLCAMEEFPSGARVHMDSYTPENEEGMALLFRQFDARVSGRSATDCSHAYQGLFSEVAKLDEKKALAAIKGINRYHQFTGEGATFSGDDIGRMFFNRNYDGFIRFIGDLITKGKSNELNRSEVLAAVYGTYLQSETRAGEFWKEVKSAHRDGHPSQVLDAQLEKDANHTDSAKKMRAIQLYAICIKAWNAHLTEEPAPSGGWKHPEKKTLPEIHSV
jgi:hypothetical protein